MAQAAAADLERKPDMLDVLFAAPSLGGWPGILDLMAASPDMAAVLAGSLFTMALAGIGLAVLGSNRREEPVRTIPVVVEAPRARRRQRRRR
jgi:hypothetical protein